MKNLISCIVFCLIVILLINVVNNILIQKVDNRYYILNQDYISKEEEFDILVFGSCHAYTSFNPVYLEKNYGMKGYVLANPGEIIPTTYLRMKEQFKEHTPKYAIVEIWGINAYDTYDATEKILGDYLENNLEQVPVSFAKLEVIKDFNLDVLEMNFWISKYKDRIMNEDLKDIDFNYSFEKILDHLGYFGTEIEMKKRLYNNGFKYNESNDVTEEYKSQIPYVERNEFLEIEPLIAKYIEKLINLCEENNVELIFYRAPYLSNENELKKLNHLEEICTKYNVPFINLEKEIEYNYTQGFADAYHLSLSGADKSTDYLANYILNKK